MSVEQIKKAYESLNGKIREKDGCIFQSVDIPADAPLIEVDMNEAMDRIEKEDVILYLGAPWCPWCRNALPVLIDVAKTVSKTIIAVDLDNKRPEYNYIDGKVVKVREGAAGYDRLESFLWNILIPYAYNDGEKEIETEQRVLSLPLVVFTKDNEISSYHYGTVELRDHQTKYEHLTKDQKIELFDIYINNIEKNAGFGCTDDHCAF